MTFEPTEDAELIRAIVTNPRIYAHLTDDFSPAREEFTPTVTDSILWLLVRDEEGLILGVWAFIKHSPVWWDVHTALLPRAWGRVARVAAGRMLHWLWANTTCRRLTTNVPEYNRLAARYALAAGMEFIGNNKKSFLKGGRMVDQLMYGVSAPEV